MFLKKFENFDNNFCVYAFLNPSKPGEYKYDDYEFEFEPIYIGKGRSNRPKNHLYKFKNGKTYFYKKLINLVGSGHDPLWIIVKNNLTEKEAFDEEVKLPRTEIVKLMTEAKESVMTVKFHRKVDEDHVKAVLKKINSKEKLNDDKFLKNLSKELI